MDAFVQSTLQSGFSVIVAAFLLLRMEGELRALREAIERLRWCQTCRFADPAEKAASGPKTENGAQRTAAINAQ